MDKPTLIESIRYRCEGRGETLASFALDYCTREELLVASRLGGDEAAIGQALLLVRDALEAVEQVCERIFGVTIEG